MHLDPWPKKCTLISKGAEAYIYLCEWYNRLVIKKTRVAKKYRIPELDIFIRKTRTRREAKLLSAVKRIGVPAPVVYDVLLHEFTIIMEYIEGILLRDLLNLGKLKLSDEINLLKKVGEYLGLMHKNDIIHGDLTTSNIIVSEDKFLSFIDFGLGEFSNSIEDKGTELRVFYTALTSTHYDKAEDYFEAFLKGYERTYDEAHLVIKRFSEISMRGRYVAERRRRKFIPS